ncbi:MAG: 3-hydroxyacyl-ACP dehydratase [Bacteroidota bacterium]
MLAEGKEIFKYIPQRPPFVFIDKLFQADKEKLVSGFYVCKDNPLIADGKLSESGLVENIAQTAAAGIGYKCIANNEPVLPGFIGAVKKLQINDLPETGSEIETTVKVVTEVMNATVIHGVIMYNEKILAECDMNIFIQES